MIHLNKLAGLTITSRPLKAFAWQGMTGRTDTTPHGRVWRVQETDVRNPRSLTDRKFGGPGGDLACCRHEFMSKFDLFYAMNHWLTTSHVGETRGDCPAAKSALLTPAWPAPPPGSSRVLGVTIGCVLTASSGADPWFIIRELGPTPRRFTRVQYLDSVLPKIKWVDGVVTRTRWSAIRMLDELITRSVDYADAIVPIAGWVE